MSAPSNMVYSTAPVSSLDESGADYVVKGPDHDVVVAETTSHVLANHLDLLVPEFALATRAGSSSHFFASKKVDPVIRDIEPWIDDHKDTIAKVIVFDIWIGNNDRNIGNLIGRAPLEGDPTSIEIVAIDFEKAHAIRGMHPIITVNAVNPPTLWPTGTLGVQMRRTPVPTGFIDRVQALPDALVERTVRCISSALPVFTWADSVAIALNSRKNKLPALVREVWR